MTPEQDRLLRLIAQKVLFGDGNMKEEDVAEMQRLSGYISHRDRTKSRKREKSYPGDQDPRWKGCICFQDEHHSDCPAIKAGKCHYQSYYGKPVRKK